MSATAEKVDNEKTYIKNVSYSAAHALNGSEYWVFFCNKRPAHDD